MGKRDIQESYSDHVQDVIMVCIRSTSTTSTASTTLLFLPLHGSQVYLRQGCFYKGVEYNPKEFNIQKGVEYNPAG